MRHDKLILIVDDDEDFGIVVCEVLQSEGYRARHCTNVPAALAALAEERPDACLLDWHIPGGDATAVGRALAALGVPVVLSTGTSQPDEVRLAVGARAVLEKPFDLDELTRLIARLVEGEGRAPQLYS